MPNLLWGFPILVVKEWRQKHFPVLHKAWGLFHLLFSQGLFPGLGSFLTCLCWSILSWRFEGTLLHVCGSLCIVPWNSVFWFLVSWPPQTLKPVSSSLRELWTLFLFPSLYGCLETLFRHLDETIVGLIMVVSLFSMISVPRAFQWKPLVS